MLENLLLLHLLLPFHKRVKCQALRWRMKGDEVRRIEGENKKHLLKRKDAHCDSDRIQTCNLLIRSQMLYSIELRSQ